MLKLCENRSLLILSVTLLIVLVVAIGTAIAEDSMVRTADYSTDGTESKVIQASYSTGQSGHRLTWLAPRLPREETTRSYVRTVQLVTPLDQKKPSLLSPSTKKPFFNDPFGDSVRLSQDHPPDNILDDNAILPDASRPLPIETLPELSEEKPPLQGESKQRSEVIPDDFREEAFAVGPDVGVIECPKPSALKPINKITHDIAAKAGNFPRECPLGDAVFIPRSWTPTTFTWKASGLCHKPAYFEDVQLERYGHSFGPYVQPIISGAHFFITVPILPYKMGLYPPNECLYTLGYYRPGSCAPYMIDPLPLSVRAGLAQAGSVVGFAYLLP